MDKVILLLFVVTSLVAMRSDIPVLSRYSRPRRIWIVFLAFAAITLLVLALGSPGRP